MPGHHNFAHTQRPLLPVYSTEYMLNPVTKPTPKPIFKLPPSPITAITPMVPVDLQPISNIAPIRDSEGGPGPSVQKVTHVDGPFCNRSTPCGHNTLCKYEEGFKGTCTPCMDMTKANHCRSWKVENRIHRNGFKDCMHKLGFSNLTCPLREKNFPIISKKSFGRKKFWSNFFW